MPVRNDISDPQEQLSPTHTNIPTSAIEPIKKACGWRAIGDSDAHVNTDLARHEDDVINAHVDTEHVADDAMGTHQGMDVKKDEQNSGKSARMMSSQEIMEQFCDMPWLGLPRADKRGDDV